MIKINSVNYKAKILGRSIDNLWQRRASKEITLTMDYESAAAIFKDNVSWSTIYQGPDYYDPEKQQMVTPEPVETDCSDYCILGDITVHRDGTVTVKMGKPTAEEINQILMEAMTR